MPKIFYIDEKKHIFKYYDTLQRSIEVKSIQSSKYRIP